MAKARPSTRANQLPLTAAGTLPKADALEHWRALPTGGTIYLEAAPADARGSSYEGDSLRLTGSLKSIDSQLSNLKSVLRYDNTKTRLDIAFSQQKEKGTSKPVPGKFVVYLKVVEKVRTTRARQAAATSAPQPAKAARSRAARPPAPTAPGRAPVPPPSPPAVQEAHEALRVLGQTPAEAQRRLELVVAAHGPGLDCARYVTLALQLPLAKKAPPK